MSRDEIYNKRNEAERNAARGRGITQYVIYDKNLQSVLQLVNIYESVFLF